MVIVPAEEAVVVNDLARAMFSPPAAEPDIKIGEHLGAVDGHIEDPRTGGIESILDEIQPRTV